MKSTTKTTNDDKFIEEVFTDLASGFIRQGALDPTGKSRDQFAAEFRKFLKENKDNIHFVLDHTEGLLAQARVYRKEEKKEFACLFYATWLEHTLNDFVSSLAKRMNFTNKEIGEIIRDTSYKSKMSWLLQLFGEKPFNNSQYNFIVKLMETRNSFVHYKWKVENEQANKELDTILANIEKTVSYVRRYDNKYVVGVSKRKVKNLIKRA